MLGSVPDLNWTCCPDDVIGGSECPRALSPDSTGLQAGDVSGGGGGGGGGAAGWWEQLLPHVRALDSSRL